MIRAQTLPQVRRSGFHTTGSTSAPARRCRVALGGFALLAVAACGGATTTSGTSSATSPAAASSPTPTPRQGPAIATLSVTGTAGLTGPLAPTEVACGSLGLDGSTIFMLAAPPGQVPNTQAAIGYNMRVAPGQVTVSVSRGAGQTFTSRTFVGTGVTGFDATRGAQLSGPLTESTSPGSNPGTIGVLSSISGSIDCGDYKPGSSSLVVTGATGDGAISGGLNPVRVECYTRANYPGVQVVGLTHAGTTPVELLIFIQTDTFTVYQIRQPSGSTSYYYTGKGAGISSFTSLGGHINGDATVTAASGVSYTVHVTGDATCGTTNPN